MENFIDPRCRFWVITLYDRNNATETHRIEVIIFFYFLTYNHHPPRLHVDEEDQDDEQEDEDGDAQSDKHPSIPRQRC